MKKNKKAGITFDQLVYGFLALIALLVGMYFVSQGAESGKGLGDLLGKSKADFDGDGRPDSIDECPCGSPINQQDEKTNIDGIEYCLLKMSPCADNEGETFKTKTNIRETQVCVYTRADCQKYITDQTK